MTDEKEQAMNAAHQKGIAAFNVYGTKINILNVVDFARENYKTEHEQDSFVAGYIGAKRRAAGSKL
jgi:hypothetical protein